jgi:prostaglandin reductase 3
MCGADDKVKYLLNELHCDQVINYKKQNVKEEIKKLGGADVVYETIGGQIFKDLLSTLKIRGRMVVIGAIVNYKDEDQPQQDQGNVAKSLGTVFPDSVQTGYLLSKSASVTGFFLNNYHAEIPAALGEIIKQVATGELSVRCDVVDTDEGIEGVGKGVEYLHTGKSIGKVVYKVNHQAQEIAGL